jgi:transposase-like protein
MADTHNGKKARRQIPAETKLQILKEARSTNLSISQVCEQYAISPTLFYQWEQIANRAALAALHGQTRGRKPLGPSGSEGKVRPSEEALLAEVQRLREVIAEITSENLQLKKGRWR